MLKVKLINVFTSKSEAVLKPYLTIPLSSTRGVSRGNGAYGKR